MEERCALCGNRTAQMDLDSVALADSEVRACPYCRKQLEQALKNPMQNSAWLQSILQMDTKGVRTDAVTAALTRLCYQNNIPRPQAVPPAMPAAPVAPPTYGTKRRGKDGRFGDARHGVGRETPKNAEARVIFQNFGDGYSDSCGMYFGDYLGAVAVFPKYFGLL